MPAVKLILPDPASYDQIIAYVFNNEASTAIIPGGAVCWDVGTPPTGIAPGRCVKIPATANLKLFAGIALPGPQTTAGTLVGIAAQTWGQIVIWGVVEEAGFSSATPSAVGDNLVVINGSQYMNVSTGGGAVNQGIGWCICLEIQTTSTVTGRVFVRAM